MFLSQNCLDPFLIMYQKPQVDRFVTIQGVTEQCSVAVHPSVTLDAAVVCLRFLPDREEEPMKGEKRQSDGQRILNKLTPEEKTDLQRKALEDRERFRLEQERKRQERKEL